MKFKIPEDQLVFGIFLFKVYHHIGIKAEHKLFLNFLLIIKQMITLSETCQISF